MFPELFVYVLTGLIVVLITCRLTAPPVAKRIVRARNRAGGWAEYSPNRNRRIR